MTAPAKHGNIDSCVPGNASKGIPLSLRGKQMVGSISLPVVAVSLIKNLKNKKRLNKAGFCGLVTVQDCKLRLRKLKASNAPGPDNFHSEFPQIICQKLSKWLFSFSSECLGCFHLSKTSKMAKIVAVLKPEKNE